MQIVYKQNQNPAHERYDHVFKRRNTSDFAAKELAKHLKQITGADFKVVEESFYDKSQPAFFIGETDFALKNKISTSGLGQEKWLYKSIGRNIVIAGGFNWGNDIAVYKFLENELNCLWLSYECSYFPVRKTLTLPKLDIKVNPLLSTVSSTFRRRLRNQRASRRQCIFLCAGITATSSVCRREAPAVTRLSTLFMNLSIRVSISKPIRNISA